MAERRLTSIWTAAQTRITPTTAKRLTKTARVLKDTTLIVVGSLLIAVAINVFLEPNNVVPGGFTALGIFANRLWGFPTGLTTLVLNIPFLLLGTRLLGVEFGPKTLIATVVGNLALDWTRPYLPVIPSEPLLYIAYGGALFGVGQALVFRAGATTGGIDIPAKLLEYFYGIRMTTSLIVMDVGILLLAVSFFGLQPALYAVITAWVMLRVVDAIQLGLSATYTALIVTQNPNAIRQAILKMDRGVTILRAEGGYTGDERLVLYTVVTRRQVAQLRRNVSTADPAAFMVINESRDVLGEGFSPLLARVR